MHPPISAGIRRLLVGSLIAAAVLATACAQQGGPASDGVNVSFIAFGDSGWIHDREKRKDGKKFHTTRASYLETTFAGLRQHGFDDYDALAAQPLSEEPHPLLGITPLSGLNPVAAAMRKHCESARCDFAVMLGDNIYPHGASGNPDEDETLFDEVFVQPFAELGNGLADFRIYATFGNHDWRTSTAGAMAQLGFMETTRPFYMDGLYYRVKPPAAGGEVELFFVDTHVLLAGTTVREGKLDEWGREQSDDTLDEPDPWVAEQARIHAADMTAWLENNLRTSTAKWKIVVGHHPFWSLGGGKYEESRALRRLILPTVCRYADAYFSGHEHTLELHTDSCAAASGKPADTPLPQIVSGAASKTRPVIRRFRDYQTARYSELQTLWAVGLRWGYTQVDIAGETMTVTMFEVPYDGSDAVELYRHRFPHRSTD